MSTEDINQEINKLKPWMGLHGWLYLIMGLLYCLSIVGAIIGIPLIIAGVGLLRAGDSLNVFTRTNHYDDLTEAFKGQKQFFLTTGVLFIVSFALPLLFLISFLLSILLNPDLVEKLDRWKVPSPKAPSKQVLYDFGEGKEI